MMRQMQRLGRSLMQAVAVMPVAALLLGIGYWIDPTGWGANSAVAAVLIKSGGAILDNLGIIFAVSVAFGLSRDNNGAAALSGLVGFLVVTTLLNPGTVGMIRGGAEVLPEEGFGAIGMGNVFIGILTGILASWAYNRFHQTKLPDALAFFSGRRLVPIVTSLLAVLLSAILLFVWPAIYSALVAFGELLTSMGPLGAAIYGFFNRLLIPTGLHHALNNVFWFDLVGINDIGNFWNNTASTLPGVTTGMYQAGFFPIMMFGLPGAALAMYHCAKPENKTRVKALFLAGAVAAFVTGVTEPIEFSFMFLAPGLYLVHAGLTAISLFIAATFKWIAGFGFSAGMIDMILSVKVPLATQWYMLIPLGLVFFALYYFIFRFIITKMNLKTPGREDEIRADEGQTYAKDTNFSSMARTILEGLGGKENIETLDYCATRLRVGIVDNTRVSESKIKQANISGVMRPSQKDVQVIVGPQVQFVYDEMKKMI